MDASSSPETMDSEVLELDNQAMEELMKEASRAKERANTMGAFGWLKCPLPKTNKTFLRNTLAQAVKQGAMVSATEAVNRQEAYRDKGEVVDEIMVKIQKDKKKAAMSSGPYKPGTVSTLKHPLYKDPLQHHTHKLKHNSYYNVIKKHHRSKNLHPLNDSGKSHRRSSKKKHKSKKKKKHSSSNGISRDGHAGKKHKSKRTHSPTDTVVSERKPSKKKKHKSKKSHHSEKGHHSRKKSSKRKHKDEQSEDIDDVNVSHRKRSRRKTEPVDNDIAEATASSSATLAMDHVNICDSLTAS